MDSIGKAIYFISIFISSVSSVTRLENDAEYLPGFQYYFPYEKDTTSTMNMTEEFLQVPEDQTSILEIDDMKITDPQSAFANKVYDRTALTSNSRKWPRGTIPYTISNAFSSSERFVIESAMQEFHEVTCLNFIPRTNHLNYVAIVKESGCWSFYGRTNKGRQKLSLGKGCITKGKALHEIMHTIGFVHEHSRPDRNLFIKVHWDNIKPGREDNFKMMTSSDVTSYKEKYDVDSIMHYGGDAFAKDNRKPTITARRPAKNMGQRLALSKSDINKVNCMYKCKKNPWKPQVTTRRTLSRPRSNDLCTDYLSHCHWILTAYYGGLCMPNNWIVSSCPRTCQMC